MEKLSKKLQISADLAARQYTKPKSIKRAVSKSSKDAKADLNDLRLKFNDSLAAIYTPATQSSGHVACQKLMQERIGDRQALRTILACLTDRQLIQASRGQDKAATSLGLHANLFGFLSKKFEKDLVDPIDSPSTRRKTYARILRFFTEVLFLEANVTIYKGCVTSMNEILECTFPEYLEDPSCQDLTKVFLEPLFQILRDRGTLKNANAAACFCLRHIVQNLTNRHSHLVTPAFSKQFTNIALRHKVTHANFVETLIDLMRFHGDGRYENRGIEGIVDEKLKQLFEYSINSISTIMANCKG